MISYVDLLLPYPPLPPPRLRLLPQTSRFVYTLSCVASRLLPRRSVSSQQGPLVVGCCRFYDRSCSGIARLPHPVARYAGDPRGHAALSRLSKRSSFTEACTDSGRRTRTIHRFTQRETCKKSRLL